MGLTITKTTNDRFKIDDGTSIEYYPASATAIKTQGDRVVMYIPDSSGDRRIKSFDFEDIDAPAASSIGNATYDETGGGVEDEWTLASHGLSVGDPVMFSAVGTGASGYAASTLYWVVAVPDANTFQLSDEQGGSAIEGTGDSSGTWTLVKWSADDRAESIEAL